MVIAVVFGASTDFYARAAGVPVISVTGQQTRVHSVNQLFVVRRLRRYSSLLATPDLIGRAQVVRPPSDLAQELHTGGG